MSGPVPSPAPSRVAGRGWRLALVASLAVNLMLVGVMAGGALRFWRAPPAQGPVMEMRALWQALPDETRAALRAELRPRHRDGARERAADDGGARPVLAPLLRADPFDAAGFAQALDAMRGARAAQAAQAQAALVARIAALPAAERAAIAERMETRPQRRLRRPDPR